MSSAMRSTPARGSAVRSCRRPTPRRPPRISIAERRLKNAITSASGRHRAATAGVRRAQHERLDAVRMAQRQALRDHAAEREAVDVRAIEADAVEDADGVVGHGLDAVAAAQRRRPPDPAVRRT